VSQQLGALQTHTTDTFLFISHTTNVLLFNYWRNGGFGSEWDTLYILDSPGIVCQMYVSWNSDYWLSCLSEGCKWVCNYFQCFLNEFKVGRHEVLHLMPLSNRVFHANGFSKRRVLFQRINESISALSKLFISNI